MYQKEYGFSKNLKSCSAILFSFIIFYIIPFLAKDPSIFMTGLKYHNDAAAFEWEHGAWSFESGIYFAPHINSLINGTFKEKVAITRLIQALSVIIVLTMGYIFYSKNRNSININYFLLGMLFSVLVVFYQFSPLTYRYYLITPLLLSICLCTVIAKQYYLIKNIK